MVDDPKAQLLEAAKAHVLFDGWSETTFAAAAADCGITLAQAREICPAGALDLARAFHQAGDAALAKWAQGADLDGMRYSAKVARLVVRRIEIAGDKELVRRGLTLFSLPQNLAVGSALLWGTADTIWTALGDTSDDANWYSKRAILSSVYGASVLYWLGDDSEGAVATSEFVDRRIENVMQFEKAKGQARSSKALAPLMSMASGIAAKIKAPSAAERRADYPGWVAGEKDTTP